MAVTQKEIATRLGLSPQAVNCALGHRTRQVSVKTRQRVLEAAHSLGYRPNSAAMAVSTGRFNAVGLLMSRHHCQSIVFGHTLRGIHDALDERDIHLAITFVDDEQLTSGQELPKILGHAMVDGLLLNYTHDIPPRMVELINRHHLSAVWINSMQPANCVYPDDDGAAVAATRRLLELGHRRICYMDMTASLEESPEWHYSRRDRRDGYARAMRDAQLEPMAIIPSRRFLHERMVDHVRQLLQSPSAPTAVITYGTDDSAAMAMACMTMGLKLGVDVSLITFGHNQSLAGPRIDTLRVPEQQLGYAAASMLLRRIEAPSGDQPPEAIPFIDVPGESVGPVPARSASTASSSFSNSSSSPFSEV